MLVGDGIGTGAVGEESGGGEAGQVVDMDAADEVVAFAEKSILPLGHGDVDTATRSVDGGGPKDEGCPGAT